MGRHDKHLPRTHLNKTAGHGAQPADAKTLTQVAKAQGQGTKEDAKAARRRKK